MDKKREKKYKNSTLSLSLDSFKRECVSQVIRENPTKIFTTPDPQCSPASFPGILIKTGKEMEKKKKRRERVGEKKERKKKRETETKTFTGRRKISPLCPGKGRVERRRYRVFVERVRCEWQPPPCRAHDRCSGQYGSTCARVVGRFWFRCYYAHGQV